MNLLMIGGDRSILKGEQGPYWYTLQDLSKQFDRIDVLCAKNTKPVFDVRQPIHGNVYFHPAPTGVLGLYFWIIAHTKTLHAANPIDRITAHAYPPFIHFLAGLCLHKQLLVPAVCEWHGIHSFRHGTSWQDAIGAIMTRFLAKKSNQFTSVRSVSTTVTNRLLKFGVKPAVIEYVPAVYIDPTIWHVQPESVKQYDIVFSGRIDANKRLEQIIQAIALLPTATLAVIGDGDRKQECMNLAKILRVSDRITWFNWLPTPNEVAAIVQASRVLCMPSGYEGGPRVVVEALACGIPVLCTNVGIVPDVVQHKNNGYIFNGTIEGLYEGLSTLLASEEYSKTAESAATMVQARFTRSVLIVNYIQWLKAASRSR